MSADTSLLDKHMQTIKGCASASASRLSFCRSQAPNEQHPPVKGPFEQELSGRLREVGTALVDLQHLVDDPLEPVRPLLQGVLLLQRLLKVLLQLVHHCVVALTHPRRLLLQTATRHVIKLTHP